MRQIIRLKHRSHYILTELNSSSRRVQITLGRSHRKNYNIIREQQLMNCATFLAKLQARAWLSHALCAPGQHTAKQEGQLSTRDRAMRRVS